MENLTVRRRAWYTLLGAPVLTLDVTDSGERCFFIEAASRETAVGSADQASSALREGIRPSPLLSESGTCKAVKARSTAMPPPAEVHTLWRN